MRPKFEYLNSDVEHYIDECIHSERNRRILKRKLIDDITFETLAEELHLSVTTVKTVVKKGVNDIYKYIRKPS